MYGNDYENNTAPEEMTTFFLKIERYHVDWRQHNKIDGL